MGPSHPPRVLVIDRRTASRLVADSRPPPTPRHVTRVVALQRRVKSEHAFRTRQKMQKDNIAKVVYTRVCTVHAHTKRRTAATRDSPTAAHTQDGSHRT